MKMNALCLFCVALLTISCGGSGGGTPSGPNPVVETTMTPQAFFTEIEGNYTIKLAGGEAPHDPNNLRGSFKKTPTQGEGTLPYCLPTGGCDPGYLDFPYESTKVYVKQTTATRRDFRIELDFFGDLYKFTATREGNAFIFRNLQYPITETQTGTLEYVLEKN